MTSIAPTPSPSANTPQGAQTLPISGSQSFSISGNQYINNAEFDLIPPQGTGTSGIALTTDGSGNLLVNGVSVGTLTNLNTANTWIAVQKFTKGDFKLLGTSTGSTILNSGLTGASSNTLTLPTTTTDTLAGLGTAQTWTAAQTFTNSDILLLGSSTGYTTFTSANASATNYTITTLAATGTIPLVVGSAATGLISTTQTNIINYTPPSAGGLYRMSIHVTNTSGTNTGSLTPSVGYKSAGGQTTFAPNFMQTNSATLLTATTGASKDFSSVFTLSIDGSATAITLTMTVSGTVAAYIFASLEQLA